jgi:replicative DNA helicase
VQRVVNVQGDLSTRPVKPNREAEQSILGSVLIDPDKVLPELMGMVRSDDFLEPTNRHLYKICHKLYMDNKAIDFVTVLHEAVRQQVFDREGDAKVYIAQLAQIVPSIANWKAYAKLVIDTAKRSRAMGRIGGLAESLQSGDKIEDCQGKAVQLCEELSTTTSGDAVSLQDGFVQFYASLQQAPEYIKTGFPRIDKMVFISPGDYIVVGARPSVGKTALTLQLMAYISKTKRVAYFSLETGNNNLFGRMAAHLGTINLTQIKTRNDLDFRRLAAVMSKFDERSKSYFVEAAGWTVAEIRAKAIQLGAEVIFVDYLGLVRDSAKSRYEKVTNISQDLHTMAQQTKITIFALSQLNRDSDKKPSMENLRESGQIEQDADVIMILHAPNKDTEEQGRPSARELYIEKNKEGIVGDIRMMFSGGTQTFSEVDSRYD